MSAQPTAKPASFPIKVAQVATLPLLYVRIGPMLTYVNLDEAVAQRAQLDAEIARLSERFL